MAPHPTADTSRRVATAFFDSQDAAEAAQRDLTAAGFTPDAIAGLTGEAEASAAPILPEDGGFWHAMKAFFLPEPDRHAYAEGLRRGGFVLSVTTGPEDYDRALDILDADGAVDIDERARDWESEGWAGWQEGIEPLAGNLGRPDNSTAGFGASFAGEDGFQPPMPHDAAGNDSAARADAGRVGTGDGSPGLLNPDMRERIGAGTASMTPPTPTGAQDATLHQNAATLDRKAAIEDASLGSPTRGGAEMPDVPSTIGSTNQDRDDSADAWTSRRDPEMRRARVRGFIVDPDKRS
ncbi:hypothetical protein P7D22_14230 [Lichenihabitans sp. Uapishka_5]|uniref:hypothetical protein n=1 Tax=Lichenihabitans sp. Uapishka_5 TaxID=3037302 RepID=UPI0029E8248C|nr:hypothetical protein [Lichenihabitans sp. Uapishka_5]MDX7952327.1 hypothetical protein [Lichenihabitans sp. Uapishka_5]